MRTGPTLTEDALDRYQPLGAFGQPVYRSHLQLQAALRQRLGKKYAEFFAVPRFDAQGRTVSWTSPVEGDPVRWSDLSEEEQVSRSLDLQVMKSEFDSYLDELRAQQNKGNDSSAAQAFVAVLEQALRTPNDGHLYFLGDRPVATFWGFREENSPPFETLTAAPKIIPKPAASPVSATESVVVEAAMPEPRRFPWWLLLLLLLLLVALSLWWLWPDESTTVGDATRAAAVEQADEPTTSEPTDSPEQPAIVEREQVSVDGGDVAVSGGSVQGDGDLSNPENKPDTTDEGGLPADDSQVRDGQTDVAQPGAEPSADTEDDVKTPQALEPPRVDDESTPLDPPVPEPGEPPVIPDDAGDGAAGFMRGTWQSDSGLVDAQTKQKLTQEYTFDGQGKGEAVIRRADGVVCRAPAEATMKGGNLQVDELEHLECTDGSSFRRSRTECTKGPSGSAECVGTDADGSRFKVELNRGSQP